ncbi:sporulation protein YabP [Clostridium estertheticum]|uniref:Sporulation protein YabP n=1 Tax=Clostridium estertheticum TaxID=238834 RepID=A0A7Y3SZM5_9CLOT|nr:sporulation protein YabP [Clostridium estertheticum]MBW9172934.1 sporulation protein YabP [Clostridium estertheticum]MBX4271052.1 sporulation protein YabP [Clostridium estertheticum]NNU77943.1 sporulation protein YabP [Clostridium estertheticum]WBL47526.1 sporulation protein YabP [Clostridium estertheticum]WLC75685.1 sporulation protein YabP [Clostridium estertheticum]
MEAKKEIKIEDKKSNLTLENRRKLTINGVIEVINFNENQILLNTDVGIMMVKGQELKMNKLDVQNGDVIITGKVDSFVYTSDKVKIKKDSIIARLFR